MWHIQPTQTGQISRNVSPITDTSELISQPEASSSNLSVSVSDVIWVKFTMIFACGLWVSWVMNAQKVTNGTKKSDGVKSGEFGVKQWVHGEHIDCLHTVLTAAFLTFHTSRKLHIRFSVCAERVWCFHNNGLWSECIFSLLGSVCSSSCLCYKYSTMM